MGGGYLWKLSSDCFHFFAEIGSKFISCEIAEGGSRSLGREDMKLSFRKMDNEWTGGVDMILGCIKGSVEVSS